MLGTCSICSQPVYRECWLINGGTLVHQGPCYVEFEERKKDPHRALVALMAAQFGIPAPYLGDPQRTTAAVWDRVYGVVRAHALGPA